MGNPYYGAYVATSAMANGSHIVALDDGKSNHLYYTEIWKRKNGSCDQTFVY
jgi:hypothetical protein